MNTLDFLQIDKTYILSLDKREKHWIELRRKCLDRGLSVDNFIVGNGEDLAGRYIYDHVDIIDNASDSWIHGTTTSKINHFNAFLSHKKIIERAYFNNYKRILLLEDDSYWTKRSDKVLHLLKPQLEHLFERQWQMLYGGWWIGSHQDNLHAKENVVVEDEWRDFHTCGLRKINHLGAGGFHGVIINMENKEIVDFLMSLGPVMPMDCQINTYGHEKLQSYYIYPKILHVLSGIWSSCEDQIVHRDKIP